MSCRKDHRSPGDQQLRKRSIPAEIPLWWYQIDTQLFTRLRSSDEGRCTGPVVDFNDRLVSASGTIIARVSSNPKFSGCRTAASESTIPVDHTQAGNTILYGDVSEMMDHLPGVCAIVAKSLIFFRIMRITSRIRPPEPGSSGPGEDPITLPPAPDTPPSISRRWA
jgi:hypothetical protein